MEYRKAFLQDVTKAEGDAGAKVFTFRATDETEDRDGEIITGDGWELDNFRKNPVFLIAHNPIGMPIGKVTRLIEDDGLIADVVFDPNDPQAMMVQSKFENGFLNAVSVGFLPKEIQFSRDGKEPPKHTRKELLEISAVAVPSNPNALALRAMGSLGDGSLIPDLPEVEGKDAVWLSIAAAMATLLTAKHIADEPWRRRLFDRLERCYRVFDKEAPEYRSEAEAGALGLEELKALFWAGEPDLFTKAGRVLSRKNEQSIREAARLLNAVLEQIAEGGDGDTEDDGKAASSQINLDDLPALRSFTNPRVDLADLPALRAFLGTE